jgi:hypothetical protein
VAYQKETRLMRLLWAKAIDSIYTAIVIDIGMGQLIGGVVYLTDFTTSINFMRLSHDSLEMRFNWVWHQVVESPEDFAASKEWERRQITEVKQITNQR